MPFASPRSTVLKSFTALALLLAVLFGPLGAWPYSTPAQAAASALPQHFGIGLAAPPSASGIYGWLPNSGIPWDYAYQYLSGGVNTGTGWETWNAGGQFPLYYAQGAASHGYVPVLTYYEINQSNGSCGTCGEAQKDLSNLANSSTMASYYGNFTTLMKRLGPGTYDNITGFGGTAIVHVEPDLSGYAMQAVANNAGACYGFCTGQGNNPAFLKASVASSGVADVAGYPNTYQGYNWALLHLRDLYAPNVQLAFHVSNWATGMDIGSNTSPTLDATGLGTAAGNFAGQSGVAQAPAGTSTYELLFNDVLDRDAGYYKYVWGSNRFWDRLNVTFPNFHRWEQFLSAAVQAAGNKPAMVWQVPIGNQYYQTENNTNGHYQDNRVEYFFAHLPELQQAGIVAVLFGAGNGGSTVQTDGMNDGITNPASFCTTDGLSSGQVCNNHVSAYSDDDGGYLREQAKAYYAAGPLPLGTGATPTPAAAATSTSTVAPTSTPTSTATSVPSSTPTTIPTSTPTRVPASTATSTVASSPTATSTRAPSATATSTPATAATATKAPSFTTRGSVTPSTVRRGSTVTASVSVSSATAMTVLVDVEIYSPSGAKVYQKWFNQQAFSAGQTRTYSVPWTVPATAATGGYTVRVGIFSPGWGTLYSWNNAAAQFTVTQ